MEKIKVAINGLGRIGRAFLRAAAKHPEIIIVAVNDLGDRVNMEYLLKYDSVYGTRGEKGERGSGERGEKGSGKKGERGSGERGEKGKRGEKGEKEEKWGKGLLEGIRYLSEKEPSKLPWKELSIDVVVEATGFFASSERSQAHLEAGAKHVVITAPTPITDGETILVGLNEEKLKNCKISSNASCTTNAAAPIIAILDEAIGIEKALLNTVHAYTATQSLVDSPAGKKGFREGRAAATNIIPSSTGAAIAVTKAYPKLEGKFDGISLRVPVICGSIADITFIAKRDTSAEEVNEILRKAAKEKRWEGIFAIAEDDLVSSDIIGSTEGAIAELSMTRVVGGNLVKVLAWYDNEAGYAHTLVRHVLEAGKFLNAQR